MPSPARGGQGVCTGGDQTAAGWRRATYGPSESGLFEVDSLHRVLRSTEPTTRRSTGLPPAGARSAPAVGPDYRADNATLGQERTAGRLVSRRFGTGMRPGGRRREAGLARSGSLSKYSVSAGFRVGWPTGAAGGSAPQEVRAWADEILKLSPTALKVLQESFNNRYRALAGIGQMPYSASKSSARPSEAREGITRVQREGQVRTSFPPYRGNGHAGILSGLLDGRAHPAHRRRARLGRGVARHLVGPRCRRAPVGVARAGVLKERGGSISG